MARSGIKAQAVRLPQENNLALDGEERREYFEHLREAASEAIECVRLGNTPKDDRFNHRVLQLITGTRRKAFCGAGRRVFGMAADGMVFPCVLLAGKDGMTLGCIDDPYAKWVEKGSTWANEHGPRIECEACWALPLCGGGCPAMLSVCGEMNAKWCGPIVRWPWLFTVHSLTGPRIYLYLAGCHKANDKREAA